MQNNVPVYNKWAAVAEDLRDRILSGEFPEGSLLPTGFELMEEYKIKDSTLNRARAYLREKGLIQTGNGFQDNPAMRCVVIYNKERDMSSRTLVITDNAVDNEDSNEHTWAGYLIEGEMKWVQNWDTLDEIGPFPGHVPLIICTANDFNERTPAPDVVVPVRP